MPRKAFPCLAFLFAESTGRRERFGPEAETPRQTSPSSLMLEAILPVILLASPKVPGPLDSYSSQKKDHGGREKRNPHPMKGIPLSEFPLCTFRESIRIYSDHTVVDWYQGQ